MKSWVSRASNRTGRGKARDAFRASRDALAWLGGSAIWILVCCVIVIGRADAQGEAPRCEGCGVNMALKSGGNPKAGNEDRIKVVLDSGFTFVRLRVILGPWLNHAPTAEYDALRTDLGTAIKRLRTGGARVVVVFFVGDPSRAITADKVVCDPGLRKNFLHTFSEFLSIFPDDSGVGVEPVNEPPSGCGKNSRGAEWADLQRDVFQRTRSTKPNLTFVVTGGGWGALDGLTAFDPTIYVNDRATLFSFHFYEPIAFTHQGEWWSDDWPRYVGRLDWPADRTNLEQVTGEALSEVEKLSVPSPKKEALRAKLRKGLDDYLEEASPDYVASRFDLVGAWATRYHVSSKRILLGEFGVLRKSVPNHGAPTSSAIADLREVRTAAKLRGFQWAFWDLDNDFNVVCPTPAGDRLCPDVLQSLSQ